MALKFRISSLDQVDDKFHDLYSEQEGGEFVLDVDGAVPVEKLNEFRDNNRGLKKELDELNTKLSGYEDLDPEKARKALETVKALDDSKLVEAGKVEELIHKRLAEQRESSEREKKALQDALNEQQAKAEELGQKLTQRTIHDAAMDAVAAIGQPRKGAQPDIYARASQALRVKDGNVVVVDTSGDVKYNGKGEPMSAKDWALDLSETAPHLFDGTSGGGAGGSGGGDDGTRRTVAATPDNLAKYAEQIAKGEVVVRSS